jgi:thioredoxin 1
MSDIHTPDAAGLQRFIDAAPGPILVQFSASWCGPCRGMAPHLEAFAQSRTGQLPVIKMDIDEHPEVASRFMVRAVPTSMVLDDGSVLGVHIGALSAVQLARFVDGSLAAHGSDDVR